MSELKLISPMLDHFLMGDPMSDHHGVRCCPAMERDSDKKYIVKIISIPASQMQLDALLLAGAYKDSASAMEYFKDLSDEVGKEAQTLQQLSKLEGFVPYENWQIVPMENEIGYDVYLLSPYKHSLQRFFRKHTMTHLGAVNLGLDLCAAMAVCRRAGMLYVDLKPGNIFLSQDQEYRVGDLGFIPLDFLKYASLPEKYRSAYTAPEIKDAFSSLNPTIDIYAIGLILYQAFNGGVLPFDGQAPEEPLPPPPYADYEMAEIILKACAPKPEDRWQTPLEMGQAIVSYMQRNGANDTPIVPPPAAVDASVPAAEEVPADTQSTEEPKQKEISGEPETVPPASGSEDPLLEQIIREVNTGSLAAEEPVPDSTVLAEEEDAADLRFMEEMVSDETAPDESTAANVEYHELSDEISDILTQADELIAHETPDPVIAPEPIDVPVPPPIALTIDEASEDEVPETITGIEQDVSEDTAVELPQEKAAKKKNRSPRNKDILKKVVRTTAALLVIAALLYGGYYFYRNYYLLTVSNLQLDGTEDQLTVRVTADIDESLLSVVCKDTHGNVSTSPVSNGTAQFGDLNPNTQYQISLEVTGFHKLVGLTSGSYNTPPQTNIIQFNATTGSEDGAVLLNFTVDGKEPEQWSVVYSAEGEEEQTVTFAGHMVTIRNLVLDKEYTFRLTSTASLYIVGNDQITYTPTALVYAQNLTITSCQNASLTATWEAPEDHSVSSWVVRCYNEYGYDQTITTEDTQAVFSDIDVTKGHTVEVTAEGMMVGTHTYITDNAVTVSNIQTDVSEPSQIGITWDFAGAAPEGGWLLLYTIDNIERQEVVPCEGNSAVIIPMVPAAHYEFTLQTASGATVFDGTFSLDTPKASTFNSYLLTADDLDFTMCLTPDKEDWTYKDVPDDDITNTFQPGQKASFMLKVYKNYSYDAKDMLTLFVIRDESGNLISTASVTRPWSSMWHSARCELDVPSLPDTPGSYTITIYFNGAYAGEESFTIAEAE